MRLIIALFLLAVPAFGQNVDQFPFPIIEVRGIDAQSEWHRLRDEPGTPVIIGYADALAKLARAFAPEARKYYPLSTEEMIAEADTITFPDALYDVRADDYRRFIAWMKENNYQIDGPETFDPAYIDPELLGRWPLFYTPAQRIIGLDDWQTGRPVETAYIAILPTENPWEAPAYLRFGGWNANPSPEIHVAALRQWHTDYGAEPALIDGAQMELWAPNRPTEREAAIELALLHFHYCEDVVLQGVGTIETLAADRMRAPYWYFWWD